VLVCTRAPPQRLIIVIVVVSPGLDVFPPSLWLDHDHGRFLDHDRGRDHAHRRALDNHGLWDHDDGATGRKGKGSETQAGDHTKHLEDSA
jgi:hypothetical protein